MLACGCLNVVIGGGSDSDVVGESLDVRTLGLGDDDGLREPFFRQELRSVRNAKAVTTKYSGLVSSRAVGPYVVYLCFNCNVCTHAVHEDKRDFVIVAANLLGKAAIEDLKKTEGFSTSYDIVVNPNPKNQPNAIYNNMSPDEKVIVNNLMQKANESINRELAAVENRIRQYSEQQHAEFEEYKSRVLVEHETLSRKILELKRKSSKENTIIQLSTNSPTSKKSRVPESNDSPNKRSLLNRPKQQPTATSSPMQIPPARPAAAARKSHPAAAAPPPRSSYDSEGLFQLEDMDDEPTLVESEHDADSADDDPTLGYSRGGGPDRPAAARRNSFQMARSLPVSIPALKAFKDHLNEDGDDKMPEESMDIAASIKALAKSIQGDTIFGDLPARPRFSSQI